MTQSTVEDVHNRRMAAALLAEFGLPAAQEYILKQMISVGSESNRKVWSGILGELNEIGHPIRFRRDLQALVLSGVKTATTRKSVKVVPGGSSGSSDNGTETRFRVTGIHEGTAEELSNRFWEMEGFDGPVSMVMELARIYPEITADTMLVTHVFEEVPA